MMTGCEFSDNDELDDEEDSTNFENSSSVAVTVTPAEDETFNPFTLQAGEEKTVNRNGDTIEFAADPGSVTTSVISNREVVFTDL